MIVVCTEYGDNYNEIAAITVPVMKEYCERHGYVFKQLILEDGNNYAFKKHEMFKDVMGNPEVEMIWYLDCDCLITDLRCSFDMVEFREDGGDFFITEDFNNLNGGSVIILNTPGGRDFNEFVLEQKDKFDNEQDVYCRYREELSSQMKVIPHPSINSYQYSLYPECESFVGRNDLGDWADGDFVIHTPGLSIEKRIEVLKKYKSKIIR